MSYNEEIRNINNQFAGKGIEEVNDAFVQAQEEIFDYQENSEVFAGWTDDEKFVEWNEYGVSYPNATCDTSAIEDYAETYVINRVREILSRPSKQDEPVPANKKENEMKTYCVYRLQHVNTPEQHFPILLITDVPDKTKPTRDMIDSAGFRIGEFNIPWANCYLEEYNDKSPADLKQRVKNDWGERITFAELQQRANK